MDGCKKPAKFAGYTAVAGSGPGMWIVQDLHGIPAMKKTTGEKCFIKAWRDEGKKWTFFVGGKTAAMHDTERVPADDVIVLPHGHSMPGARHS